MVLLPGAEPFAFDGGPTGALLVHGLTGSPASLRPWGKYLAAAGLTVVGPRLPGHGTRVEDMAATRWEDWYAEVERAYTALRARCDEVFVMGLSMGAALTLRLAETNPGEITGAVLVNAAIASNDRRLLLLPVLKHIVKTFPGIAGDIKKPGVTEVAYDRTPLKPVASMLEGWKAVRADLGKVDCPVLHFHSREDHIVDPSSSGLLNRDVPRLQEVVLENSYHVATLDNDAERIFGGSLDFARANSRTLSG
ncbi:MAG: alpha/beta hydrolase [Frankiaceae bacterium]